MSPSVANIAKNQVSPKSESPEKKKLKRINVLSDSDNDDDIKIQEKKDPQEELTGNENKSTEKNVMVNFLGKF